ncbi:hypothetical protein MD484_g4707, partial [Candolleomyces efflorescens]
MNDGKSKKELKALLRENASSALFPILDDLEIRAALTHRAAFALHRNTRKAGKELKVVVNHKDGLTVGGVCTAVASHPRGGDRFKIDEEKDYQLNYTSEDPEIQGELCTIVFILSGGPFPAVVQDFDEVIRICQFPVLPIHAILLERLVTRSRTAAPGPLGKTMSPLWQSSEVLDMIFQYSQEVPGDVETWIACGIDPSTFVRSPSQGVVPVEGADETTTVTAPENKGEDDGHRVVTEIVAREVVYILQDFRFECAILGSAASQLYSNGDTRVPEQLDILILPTASFTDRQGWLKQRIFRRDPSQFEWHAQSKSLFYKFQPDVVLPPRFQGDPRCKVEILIPGTASLASSDIVWIDDLPVIPFLALLLSKLQTWGNDTKRATARDVKNLLSLAVTLPVSQFRPWRERDLMSNESQAASEQPSRLVEGVDGSDSSESVLLASIDAVVHLEYEPGNLPSLQEVVKQHGGRDDESWTRFVCISDTHSRIFEIPDGDVLLHAGDLTTWGHKEDMEEVLDWLCGLKHKVKMCAVFNFLWIPVTKALTRPLTESSQATTTCLWIVTGTSMIGGGFISRKSSHELKLNHGAWRWDSNAIHKLLTGKKAKNAGIVDLENQQTTFQIAHGRREWTVYGSPWTASRYFTAFQYLRDSTEAREIVSKYTNADILLTHSPPFKILGLTKGNENAGCEVLADHISQGRLRPRLHVFGHIHEARGAFIHQWGGSETNEALEVQNTINYPAESTTLGPPNDANRSDEETRNTDKELKRTVFVNAANKPSGVLARRNGEILKEFGGPRFRPVVVDMRD